MYSARFIIVSFQHVCTLCIDKGKRLLICPLLFCISKSGCLILLVRVILEAFISALNVVSYRHLINLFRAHTESIAIELSYPC